MKSAIGVLILSLTMIGFVSCKPPEESDISKSSGSSSNSNEEVTLTLEGAGQ